MLIRLFAVLAICAGIPGAAGAGKISHTDHNFQKAGAPCPQIFTEYDALTSHEYSALETALQRFERDLAGKRGTAEARSSKPKEIVVVGSKIKEARRSSRARRDRFSTVEGMDSNTEVVEFREGGEPSSLRVLQAAIRRFEKAAGPRSPCVGRCRTAQRRCLSRCQRALRQRKASGRCVCEHIRARCLVKAAKGKTCIPPDPVRRRRR
ncbi:MAG: hypothetical protein ACLFV8_05515 [Alphaproteobacteria bacterium]